MSESERVGTAADIGSAALVAKVVRGVVLTQAVRGASEPEWGRVASDLAEWVLSLDESERVRLICTMLSLLADSFPAWSGQADAALDLMAAAESL